MILNRNLLSLALASALLGVFTGANAQTEEEKATQAEQEKLDAADGTLEAVVVTGIRGSIESSINRKRENASIVEVISAEDIGKLPDTSIAESIARLPGLTAQRVSGRSSTISIRGLAGDFSTTLLNGREQVSSGDNRGVEFDQYPSELLSSVVVYKTPDAALVATGISGTVDLRTIRPLEVKDRVLSVNARIERNSLGELNPDSSDTGSRFSFAYVDKFADDTVGVAIGFARLDSPGQGERWNAWGYADANDAPGFVAALGGTESFATSTDNVRNGLIGVLEFAPNDSYNGAVDVYYSNFDRDETTRGLQAGVAFSDAAVVPGSVRIADNFVNAANLTGVRSVVRNDLNTRQDKVFAFGFKNMFTLSDYWKATADFSLSSAERSESILETYSGLRASDTLGFTFNRADGRPTLNFGRNYTNAGLIQIVDAFPFGQGGYVKFPEFDDELRSVLLSAERTFEDSAFRNIQFGVNFSSREKSRSVAEAFLDLRGAPGLIPADLLRGVTPLSLTGIPGVLAYDVNRAFETLYRPRSNVNQDILNKDWEVSEDVINAFVKLDLDTMIGEMPLRGNIGFQYVRADQESQGFAVPGGNASIAQPFSGGAKYGKFLPSLNLSAEIAETMFLRFGAAKTLARPRMDQMRANSGFGIDNSRLIYSGGGGNPELRPWAATGYDLSLEKYFGSRGYVSVAVFNKDLTSYIFEQRLPFDFSVFNLTSFTNPIKPRTTIGEITTPANGEGGSINGLEFAFSVPFDLVADALDGFGILGSYSDTRSSISPDPLNNPTQPLPGLSRYVSNLTMYYENYGFSARISQRSRSQFNGEVQGFGADRDTRFVAGEKILDFQTGYEFTSGGLEGLSLLLQVNNLDNEPYQELSLIDGQFFPRSYNEYGRTVLLGANYKF